MEPYRAKPIERAMRVLYRTRRRVATGLAVGLALLFGYHAIFGQNGITAYAQKRSEDRVLGAEIEKLKGENSRLKEHVDRLGSDPDAIEHEAREQLHYARPGEVIYTLNDAPPQAAAAISPASQPDPRSRHSQ